MKKLYSIIYADPPWKYKNQKGNDPRMGGITYPVMSEEELGALKVSEIAEKDCSLFMWATMPKLKEALWLGEKWGFRYITCAFTWVKQNPSGNGIYSGLGHWTNGNAELCLFFKKGTPKRVEKNVKQIQIHPRGRHSVKPPVIRNEIIRLVGDLPRIELFARVQAVGWDVWGNEIESDIEL
jgi:site-specific DNA-methyltransferase (adenine-specific)